MNKDAVEIISFGQQSNDFDFWKKKSHLDRLRALESIRKEYNDWKYGSKQRLQRVYRITQFE